MSSMEKTNVLPGLLVAGVCVVSVVLLALFSRGDGAPDTAGQFMLEVPVRESDHVLGSSNASIVIVEYADFQCPTCRMVSPMLHQLVAEGEGEVAVVFRYFPLPQHENALPAARAAEAAGLQGKFWEMHDLLFENQVTWEKNTNPMTVFGEYARDLGLDTTKFATDYASDAVVNRVQSDESDAKRNRLTYTPTLFLNGVRIQNPKTYEELKQLVTEALTATAQ